MKLAYCKVYRDFISIARELDNGARGRLFMAILEYINDEEPTNLTGAERIAFLSIKAQIDRDAISYDVVSEARSIAGKAGAQKRWGNRDKEMANAIFAINENGKNGICYKNKEKEKEKDKEKDVFTPPTPSQGEKEILAERSASFSPSLLEAVKDWLAYKKERNQGYKPQGLKAFLTETQNNADRYGQERVVDAIRLSMAANYQGIVWDKLKAPQAKQDNGWTYPQKKYDESFLDSLAVELGG